MNLPITVSQKRQQYLETVKGIRAQIGSLEDVRKELGFSRKDMAELLLVDPSAWSRWVRDESKVPPHVYRSLNWYLQLREHNKNSELNENKKTTMTHDEAQALRAEIMQKLTDMRASLIGMEKEALTEWMSSERRELLQQFEKEAKLGGGWKLLLLVNLFGLILIAIFMI